MDDPITGCTVRIIGGPWKSYIGIVQVGCTIPQQTFVLATSTAGLSNTFFDGVLPPFSNVGNTERGAIPDDVDWVITEDVGLSLRCLHGFPGPYCKPMLEAIGDVGLWEMMSRYEDRHALVTCTLEIGRASCRERV